MYKTEGDKQITCLKLNTIHERVHTAILLKVLSEEDNSLQCEIKEFGFRALKECAKIKRTDRNNYVYFERIKMNLQHEEVSYSVIKIIMPNAIALAWLM